MTGNPRTLPLLVGHGANDVVLWSREGPLTANTLLRAASTVARVLPAHRYYFNGCERRSTFLVGFLAALMREATTLLPMTRSEGVLAELERRYPDQMTITDATVEELCALSAGPAAGGVASTDNRRDGRDGDARVAADHVAAIVFTSGSTGAPQGHAKTWATLLGTAELARERFLAGLGRCNLVTTVPSQHMYGLETSVMLTLGGGCAVSDTRPFFPRDVVEELASIPEPRVLVTTPAHLRACVAAEAAFPPLALVISATAPLSAALAGDMEKLSGAALHEIYGCTEAGSMASRRTVDGDLWRPYRDSRLDVLDGRARFVGAHLPAPVPLQDVIEVSDAGRFRLVGRSVDLVKIAGKRASLADLTQQLLAVDGVVDGVIFMPSEEGRCAALVVAPQNTREQVLAALATRVDPAFMPRPLKLVARLPRSETGKLPRSALLAALEEP
jgi:acyl-coenzyme A synthetase/AMP-(fatty) acid ligase